MSKCGVKTAAVLVIWFVGVYAIASLLGCFVLFNAMVSKDKTIPSDLVPILMALSASGGGAITGLIGLLGRTQSDAPPEVKISNAPSEPVPVEDIK